MSTHQDRGRRSPPARRCPRAPSPSSAPPWCSTPARASTATAIHWDERVRHVGRPARRHRPRHVHHGLGGHRRHRLGGRRRAGAWSTAPASPSRSSSPGRAAPTSRSSGVVKSVDPEARRATVELTARLQRRQGARPRRGRRGPRLSRPTPMREEHGTPLSTLTTMRVGGPAQRLVTAETTDELVDAVREVDDADEPLLRRLRRLQPRRRRRGLRRHRRAGRHQRRHRRVRRTAAAAPPSASPPARAGTTSSPARSPRAGPASRRCPASPGATGATPIQNVGAYGQEVAQTIAQVRVWDRREQQVRTFANADCGFTYRHSRFKAEPPVRRARRPVPAAPGRRSPRRWPTPTWPAPSGSRPGARVPLADAREAVLAQRRRRGMVLDADDHDTWSCGSFFTNPVLSAERFAALRDRARERPGRRRARPAAVRRARRPGQDQRRVADRAGRLRQGLRHARPGGPVDQAHPGPDQPGRRHAPPTSLALAREIRDGVQDTFGVTLVNEPVLVGASL